MRASPILGVMLCGVAAAPAQEPLTLRVETRVVEINVAVKDANGRPVRNLRKEDFTVTDNGKQRAIQLFSGEEEPAARPIAMPLPPNVFSNRFGPRTASRRVTAILIDAVNTPFEHQGYARGQAIQAVERMTPGESIALYAMTATDLAMLQDYTTDRDLLLKAIRAYVPRPPRQPDRTGEFEYRAEMARPGRAMSTPPRRPRPGSSAGFLMRERIETTLESLRMIARHMSAASGRKSIVWITAGYPPNADFSQQTQSTLAAINDSNVAVYPVDARGLLPGRGAMINIQLMQEFAQSTGGQAYYNRNDLDRAIEEAVEGSRYTYSLGFYLTDRDFDGRFHALKVTANRPSLVLHHRRGYTAARDVKQSKDAIEMELLNPVDSDAIGIDARVEIVEASRGKSLKIRMALAPDSLTWADPIQIAQLLVETDARGYALARISEKLSFRLKTPQSITHYERTLPLREGARKLRVIVRDVASGRTGSLTIALVEQASTAVPDR